MQMIGFYTLAHGAGACKVGCLGWRHQVWDLLPESPESQRVVMGEYLGNLNPKSRLFLDISLS